MDSNNKYDAWGSKSAKKQKKIEKKYLALKEQIAERSRVLRELAKKKKEEKQTTGGKG